MVEGKLHVEFEQDYARLLRRLHKETKVPIWLLIAEAIDQVYGDPTDIPDPEEEMQLFPSEEDT